MEKWTQTELAKIPTLSKERHKNWTLKYVLENYLSSGDTALEFGVCTGGTINLISQYCKMVYGFDSFEGLPEEWIGVAPKGKFKVDQLPSVGDNVTLVKGLFSNTLEPFLEKQKSQRFKLIHIDCDLYSSTKYALSTLKTHGFLVPGTILVFDELINYPDFKDGEWKALYELDLSYQWIGTHGDILYSDFPSRNFKTLRQLGYQQEAALVLI